MQASMMMQATSMINGLCDRGVPISSACRAYAAPCMALAFQFQQLHIAAELEAAKALQSHMSGHAG
jgi:hypothetical protein